MRQRWNLVVCCAALMIGVASVAQTGTSSIQGRMWDASADRPIAGVVVKLSPNPVDPITNNLVSPDDLPNGNARGEAVTDYRGVYAFHSIPAGNYRMEIVPPAAYAVTQDHDFKNASIAAGQSVTVDWPLDAVVEVTGVVKNSSGGVMARVPVYVEVLNSQADSEAITDGQGQFTAMVPARCGLHFKVSSHGEIADSHLRYEVEGKAATFEISLLRGAGLSGHVVDAQNRPMPNARVDLQPGGSFAYADDRGQFAIANLMPENYTVRVTPPDDTGQVRSERHEQIVLRLKLAPGEQVTNLALLYNPAGERTISGRVTDTNEKPLPHANMYWGSREHGWAEIAQTREDGTYAVKGLISGDYHLVYVEYGGEQYDSDSIVGLRRVAVGSSGADFKIKLAPPRPPKHPLEIRVVSAVDKAPITSFDVMYQEGVDQILNAEKYTLTGFLQGPPRDRINDSRGVHTTGKHVGVSYSLAIRAPGYGLWVGVVETDDEVFTVKLEPEAWVRGRATDRDGNPVASAMIMYHSIFGYRMPEADEMAVLGKSDADGNFNLGGLPLSEVQLMFIHADHADTTVHVRPNRHNPAEETIVMPRAGVIAGTVYLDGKPLSEPAFVDYWDPETTPGYGIGGNVLKADGTYRIMRLPEGTGTVKASVKKQVQEVTVDVVEGQTTTVDFRFTSSK